MGYKAVLISAGHSDSDPGAVSGSYTEANLAKRIRNLVVEELIKRIPTRRVISDGYPNDNMSLKFAIQIMKQVDGPRVELHLNAGVPKASGVEALSLAAHRPLAQALAQAVSSVLAIPLRGDKGWKDQAKAGPHSRLGFCVNGGVILELCFISNKNDVALLIRHEKDIAAAIADVLEQYARNENNS